MRRGVFACLFLKNFLCAEGIPGFCPVGAEIAYETDGNRFRLIGCSPVMICKNLLPLAFSILLCSSIAQGSPFGSWSARGVVVRKTFRPTPLTHSLGVDGIYKLELRDKDNKIRRQMVTRDVFEAYQVGDEFNDQEAPRHFRKTSVIAQQLAAVESDDSRAATKVAIKDRLANVHFTQDMLPETEGF